MASFGKVSFVAIAASSLGCIQAELGVGSIVQISGDDDDLNGVEGVIVGRRNLPFTGYSWMIRRCVFDERRNQFIIAKDFPKKRNIHEMEDFSNGGWKKLPVPLAKLVQAQQTVSHQRQRKSTGHERSALADLSNDQRGITIDSVIHQLEGLKQMGHSNEHVKVFFELAQSALKSYDSFNDASEFTKWCTQPFAKGEEQTNIQRVALIIGTGLGSDLHKIGETWKGHVRPVMEEFSKFLGKKQLKKTRKIVDKEFLDMSIMKIIWNKNSTSLHRMK